MEPPKKLSSFTRAVLAGVLAGIVAVIVNLIYNLIFRSVTDYTSTDSIGFLIITFGTLAAFLVTGILFFLVEKTKGSQFWPFKTLLVVLTVAGICLILFFHAPGHSIFYGPSGLLEGITLLSGLLAAFAIPYLYNHPRMYI
jgi:uncharacterized membrane protein